MTSSLFSVVGINHHSADVQKRSEFALNKHLQTELYSLLKKEGKEGIMILSTCNRTEIYGTNIEAYALLNAWQHVINKPTAFKNVNLYLYNDAEAIQHLCKVTSGMESQIPGDYDIVHQVKKSFIKSKELSLSNGLLEKIVNCAIRASKRIKHETKFSSGSSSVSFATAEYVKKEYDKDDHSDVLVIGLGKMGKAVTKHLLSFINKENVYVTNRTQEKCKNIQEELGVNVIDFNMLNGILHYFSRIVVAAELDPELLSAHQFRMTKKYYIYDLTVPSCIKKNIKDLKDVEVYDIDEISAIVTQNLTARKAELPKVLGIIENELLSFAHWLHIQTIIKLKGNFTKTDLIKLRSLKMDPIHLLSDTLDMKGPLEECSEEKKSFTISSSDK